MPRYRVTYVFTDQFVGDEHAIRKVIRDLSYATDFDPTNINQWKVVVSDDEGYRLTVLRTVSRELWQDCEKEAIRIFLYNDELPPRIDVTKIRVEALEPVLAEVAA